MATLNRDIEQIRKTAAQLWADNATLESGQLAIESDTKKGKIGPGSFRSLPYADFSVVDADADYASDQRDGGGEDPGDGQLTADELAAVNGASSPSASNVFVTTGVLDTGLSAKEDLFIPIIHINSGSLRGSLRQTADQNGRDAYQGTVNSVLWSLAWDGSTKWRILNGDGDGYEVAQDVVTPDLITDSWSVLGSAVAPLPTLTPYGPTGQEAVEELADKVSPALVYRALLTQAGTAAPEAIVLENSLGVVPTFSRDDVGAYQIAATGIFITGKCALLIQNPQDDAATKAVTMIRFDNNACGIYSFNDPADGVYGDDAMADCFLQILKYP